MHPHAHARQQAYVHASCVQLFLKANIPKRYPSYEGTALGTHAFARPSLDPPMQMHK